MLLKSTNMSLKAKNLMVILCIKDNKLAVARAKALIHSWLMLVLRLSSCFYADCFLLGSHPSIDSVQHFDSSMDLPPLFDDVVLQESVHDGHQAEVSNNHHEASVEDGRNGIGLGTSNIDEQIRSWTTRMQSVWDEFRAPLAMQDKMMKMFFGVQPSKGRRPMSNNEEFSLASILLSNEVKKVKEPIAQNLEQLFCHYFFLGMVEPKRWQLSVGSEHRNHQPRVFSPRKCICPSGTSIVSKVKYCKLRMRKQLHTYVVGNVHIFMLMEHLVTCFRKGGGLYGSRRDW